jgi:hypothetical protein
MAAYTKKTPAQAIRIRRVIPKLIGFNEALAQA